MFIYQENMCFSVVVVVAVVGVFVDIVAYWLILSEEQKTSLGVKYTQHINRFYKVVAELPCFLKSELKCVPAT